MLNGINICDETHFREINPSRSTKTSTMTNIYKYIYRYLKSSSRNESMRSKSKFDSIGYRFDDDTLQVQVIVVLSV